MAVAGFGRQGRPPLAKNDCPPDPRLPAYGMSALPVSASLPRPREVERGMLLMVGGVLVVPSIDALAKLLTGELPAGEIAWSRFLFQTLFMAPWALLRLRQGLPPHLWLHAGRGMLLAAATLLFFAALKYLPLADSIAIFFVEPLILTLLSAVILGEPVGWRRLSAVAVGFVGALLVIQPSYQVFGPAALLPVGAALSFALYLVLTRRLAASADAASMQFWAGLFGLGAMSLALVLGAIAEIALLDPRWPSPRAWLMMALLGLIATFSHLLMVKAFRLAPAGVLAPFGYLEIIGATVLGFLIFGEFPDGLTWLGILIIVGAGLYVFQRERQLGRSASG